MRPTLQAVVGGASILTGAAFAVILPGLNPWIPILLIPFGVLLIAGAVMERMKTDEGPPDDERLRKIRAFARSYSWQVSFVAQMFLLFVDFAGMVRLSGREVLVALFLLAGISASVAELYLLREGDAG